MEGLTRKLDELNVKKVGLEAEVAELKIKLLEAKKANIIEFKESNTYKLTFNTATT